jgi:DNA-binding CsgD family transcriptional regulator
MPPAGGVGSLFDRERELARIDDALVAVGAGGGRVLVVRGQAGVGKTSLLDRLHERAEQAGLRVAAARGGTLEQRFAFGVVRQLFERMLARLPEESRAAVLAGAAAGAAAVLGLAGPPAEAAGLDLLRALHSLYWLCANLADDGGLLLVVDDAHWADAESLRWLSYMSNRVEDLPLLVAVGERSGEAAVDPVSLAAIAAAPAATVVEPGPLGPEAAARLVRDEFGDESDERFCRACHLASGGNPFYLRELVLEADRQRIEPVASEAERVGALGPPAISRATVDRLGRLPAPAGELAQAVAVLGLDAELRHAADLIGAGMPDVEAAADALAAAGILTRDRPLNFRHPVVRAAIHAEMPPGAKSEAHARAADMLANEGADAGVVASHLLLVDPAGDAVVLERLERAAEEALRRGAPATAVSYLRRALEEAASAEGRAQVLYRLGHAELLAGDQSAPEHLTEAVRVATDPALITDATVSLSTALGFAGDLEEADRTAARTLERLAGRATDEQFLRLEGLRLELAQSPYSPDPRTTMAELLRIADRAGPAGRVIYLIAGTHAAISTGHAAEARAFIDRGLDGGRFIAEAGADLLVSGETLSALAFVDELDAADELLEAVFEDARGRGSIVAYLTGLGWRGWIEMRRGRLAAAATDERNGIELATQHGVYFVVPFMQSFLAVTLLEQGDLGAATELAERIDVNAHSTQLNSLALYARGRVRLAAGRRADAVADLTASKAAHDSLGIGNPNIVPWRSFLALALGRGSERARALVAEDLELARLCGSGRAIGVALWVSGLMRDDDGGIALLREAVAALEDAPAPLERARALQSLGAALRRQGRRREAREPLLHALDIADRIGAEGLAADARAELLAAGGRPRRRRLTGAESLTPTERRVANMAAGGMSNNEIAQALFVSHKTVEMHLGNAYRKLEIHSRADLGEALGATAEIPG